MVCRPHARQHEQLGGTKSTPRHNDFFARTNFVCHAIDDVLHANGALAFKHDLRGMRLRNNVQVGLMAVRVQVSTCCIPTLSIFLSNLSRRNPKLLRAVVIWIERNALLIASLNKSLIERAGTSQITNIDWPIDAAVGVFTKALVVFRFFEIGQHLLVGPALVAKYRPVVIVKRIAACVNHGIDRRAAAHHFAAGLKTFSAIEASLWHSLIAPTVDVQRSSGSKSEGGFDKHRIVWATCLKQAHRCVQIFRQSAGNTTAC